MRRVTTYIHNDDVVPVFPLPDFILFPGVIASLHIFEPRYRQMMEHLLDRQGVMCMGILRDAAPRGRHMGKPDFWGLGCACRILDYDRLEDGRYNLVVEGLVKVRMREMASKHLFRQVSTTLMPALPEPPVEASKERRIRHLMSRIMAAAPDIPEPVEERLDALDLATLLNLMAYHCPIAVDDKLKLFYAPTVAQLCDRLIKVYEAVEF